MTKHAAALFALLEQHQLTQHSLAIEAQIGYATIYRYLNDDTSRPSAKTVDRLAAYFGVSPSVVRGEDAIENEPTTPHATRLIAVIRRADRNRYLSQPVADALATIIVKLR